MTEPEQSPTEAYIAIARIEQRRAAIAELVAIVIGVAGVVAVMWVGVDVLGARNAIMLGAGVVAIAVALAFVNRSTPVPGWLQVRAPRASTPAVEPDEVASAPYAPARTVADGAPRSPMSGR